MCAGCLTCSPHRVVLLRRGPLSTAIRRVCAGGLKPEITVRVCQTRPGCYRAMVVKYPVLAGLGQAESSSL